MQKETGPIRRYWNYFKRGKSEINFILTIYNTIILIWAGSSIAGGFWKLVQFSSLFLAGLLVVAIIVGKYSLEKVDTALPYINPFAQDVTRYRSLMAKGMQYQTKGMDDMADIKFKSAELVLRRWLNEH